MSDPHTTKNLNYLTQLVECLKIKIQMKRKSASNYDRQVLMENAFGILFSLALTAILIMNLDQLAELGNSIGIFN